MRSKEETVIEVEHRAPALKRTPGTAPRFLYQLFNGVLPCARKELQQWTNAAAAIPDPELRRQALASIRSKRFHADGGCVYAAGSSQHSDKLVRLIMAYQTISDYLDNLCDRCHTYDMADFRQLHHAMRDAIRPGSPLRDYYRLRGNLDDGGYLHALVRTCQEEVARLPGYPAIASQLEWFAERYCELQEYKHIEPSLRHKQLTDWWETYKKQYPELSWWEFAAASGSTLGIFALFLAATDTIASKDAEKLADGYFPWICGLHILLDYFIDLEEDRVEGDFNFVSCYDSLSQAIARVRQFARTALHHATQLSGGHVRSIHRYVVLGLLGMYLSDAKVTAIRHLRPIRRILWRFGPTAWLFYVACSVYRVVR